MFAPLQMHLQSAKQRTFPKPFFQRADDQHIVSCWRYCVKRKADRGRVIGRLYHLLANARKLLFLRCNRHIIARLIPPALLFDDPLNPPDFPQLIIIPPLRRFARIHLQLQMARVVPAGNGQCRMLHLKGACCHPIEKIPVVRDHYKRTPVGQQIIFQPLNRANVQMVRRLVQEQQGRLREQDAGEQRFAQFSAAQHIRRFHNICFRKAQSQQHGAGAAAKRQPASLLIFLLQPVLPADQDVVRSLLQSC